MFRAVDKHGQLIDCMLSDQRDTRAADRFRRKAVKTMGDYPPSSITADKLASYLNPIWRLQNEGLLANNVKHRTSKYLYIIEADHRALKRVVRPTCCFQRIKTELATLIAFEAMRMICRDHCDLTKTGAPSGIRFVNELFGPAA